MIKRLQLSRTVILTMLLTGSLTTTAALANGHQYIEASLGGVFSDSDNLFQRNAEAISEPLSGYEIEENGGVYGITWGYSFNTNLALELDYRYRESQTNDSYLSGADGMSYQTLADIESNSLMLNGRYSLPLLQNGLSSYLKVGVGYAHNKTSATLDINPLFTMAGPEALAQGGSDCPGSTRWCYPSDSQSNFAWSIGAGVQMPLTETAYIGLDYQYIDLGEAKGGIDANADWVESKTIANHELSLKVGLSF